MRLLIFFTYYLLLFYIIFFIYYNLIKRGVRISLRSTINDSLITGLRIVDSILPVGKGQRQLILGDRYTGKTSIYLSLLLHCNYLSLLGSIEGLGTKRIFGIFFIISLNSMFYSLLGLILRLLSLLLFYPFLVQLLIFIFLFLLILQYHIL